MKYDCKWYEQARKTLDKLWEQTKTNRNKLKNNLKKRKCDNGKGRSNINPIIIQQALSQKTKPELWNPQNATASAHKLALKKFILPSVSGGKVVEVSTKAHNCGINVILATLFGVRVADRTKLYTANLRISWIFRLLLADRLPQTGNLGATSVEDWRRALTISVFFLYVKIKSVRETFLLPFFGNFHAHSFFSRTL